MWLVKFKLRLGAILPLIFMSTAVIAQDSSSIASNNPNNWSYEAREKYVLLKDNKDADHRLAREALLWLLTNEPNLPENVYIYGIKLYKDLINETTDKDLQVEYYNDLLYLYDQRIKKYGDKEKLLTRRATDAYLIGKRIDGIYPTQLQLFNEVYLTNADLLTPNLLLAYMDIVRDNFVNDQFNQDSLIFYFIRISELFFDRLESGTESDEVTKNQELSDKIFMNLVDLSCDEIRNRFYDKLEGRQSLYYVRLIVKFSLIYKCTDEEFFLPSLEKLYHQRPSVKLALFLSGKYENSSRVELAGQYLEEALHVADSLDQKAVVIWELANYHNRMGNREKSRQHIIEYLKLRPGEKSAYELWGDLYYYSYHDCIKGASRVEDRSVFLAAYEKYKLAGNDEKMKKAETQFPSASDIHMENYSPGDTLKCACWVNENVVIRKRPEE